MRLLSVFGTRPEAIKMAPVVKALSADNDVESLVCVSGQHREMLDKVLLDFGIVPDVDLDIMTKNQTLHDTTSKIVSRLQPVLAKLRPDTVLVHGDTATTLGATLASYFAQIPVGHVEAGLRSGDLYAPWPEEGNRRATGSMARYHFAPTSGARKNLLCENVPSENIVVTGNTVIDALFLAIEKLEADPALRASIAAKFRSLDPRKRLILVTAHRRESFGAGIENICRAILDLSERNPDVQFMYPMHPNPSVRKPVTELLSGSNNVILTEPLDYLPFVYLMKRSYLILTDSGGIQEEAPSLNKPVLVLRETTERPEALAAGAIRVVGTDPISIIMETERLLQDATHYRAMSQVNNPYGDGAAAQRILGHLLGKNQNEVEAATIVPNFPPMHGNARLVV